MTKITQLSVLSVAAAMLLLSTAVFGQTNKPSDESKSAPAPASERAAAPDQNIRTQNNATERAALGVWLNDSANGAMIVGLMPGGAAERAGLRVGDEIRAFDGRQVDTPQAVAEEIRMAKPAQKVELQVDRNGQSQMVTATLGTQAPMIGAQSPTMTQPPLANPQAANSTAGAAPSQQQRLTAQQLQALQQQVNLLNQQIYLLNQQINQLQATQQPVTTTTPLDQDDWWNRVQTGDADDDPALFQ